MAASVEKGERKCVGSRLRFDMFSRRRRGRPAHDDLLTHADGTEEWMAFFKDPEGRPLAIVSQVQ